MDQTKGAGHHAVTKMAVHELYTSLPADSHGLINGQSEEQFRAQLDKWQHYQDRLLDPAQMAGPTTHPGWLDGHAQREHSMADPHLSGLANLNIDRDYVIGELDQAHGAHIAGNAEDEMKHLGAATHGLEDSYSDGHMWRDQSVYTGNPYAHVQSINVFDPGGVSTHGPLIGEGTHDPRFDVVPVDKSGNPILPNHGAAAKASAEMLRTYEATLGNDPQSAHVAFTGTVGRFFQAAQEGVHVNDKVTDTWTHQRDHRLAETQQLVHDFHDQTPTPQPAHAQPQKVEPPDGGAPPGGAPPQSQTGGEQGQGADQQPAHTHPPGDQSMSLPYESDKQHHDDGSGSNAVDAGTHPGDYQSMSLAYESDKQHHDDGSGANAVDAGTQHDDHQSIGLAYESDKQHHDDGSGANAADSGTQHHDSTGANTGDLGAG